ncbi:hypothetical protein AVEN_28881-1 [Araneus ventricosus]|uniref:Uncharacterized protein n=1 Tax=Araneus ventricosus TaxID=182803 RepID=A0A4Y2AJK6_ARAVE|nr:hypothetical protein AVEN_28881-1 [Araneus ventricosus]
MVKEADLPPSRSDQRQEQQKATASGRVCRRHPRLQLLIRLLHRNPAFRLRDAPISLAPSGRPSSGCALGLGLGWPYGKSGPGASKGFSSAEEFGSLSRPPFICLAPIWVVVGSKKVCFALLRDLQLISKKRAARLLYTCLIDDIWLRKLQKEREKQKRSLWLVKRQLQSGADPNLLDIYGETPLIRAVRQNNFYIVKELLMFGGNVHLRNVDSDTCLLLLSWSFEPNKDILVELVKNGACVNCFRNQGKSVMDFMLRHYQAEEGLETVKLLIKTATLVNWENKICFELETNSEFHCLEEFIDCCYTEVSRMKSCSYSDKSNLCHFALNGGNASQNDESSGKSIFDEVFETLVKDNFSIYDDFIRAHFDKTFLFEKSLKMNIYARNEEKKKAVHLKSGCRQLTLSKLRMLRRHLLNRDEIIMRTKTLSFYKQVCVFRFSKKKRSFEGPTLLKAKPLMIF